MKDIKTFLIGFLMCACMFLIMGQKSNERLDRKSFGEIEVDAILIRGEDGLVKNFLNANGLAITNSDPTGSRTVIAHNGIEIRNKNNKIISGLYTDDSLGGLITVRNNNGDRMIALDSQSGGNITILNKNRKQVASIQANQNQDGAIYLSDQNGEFGWFKDGKK